MKSITICLHTGIKEVMEKQMQMLSPLNDILNINWNNRYERHPDAYDSWSALTNDAIVTSKDEFIVVINDRTVPRPYELLKILTLLYNGFAAATIFSVGFIGFSKELFRTIGFFDERFYGGGWEDDDFVLRLKLADLAYYESREGTYDFSWKSHLRPLEGQACSISGPRFGEKWIDDGTNIKRVILEDDEKYKAALGPRRLDISSTWKKWEHSILKVDGSKGPSMTRHFMVQPTSVHGFKYTREITSI